MAIMFLFKQGTWWYLRTVSPTLATLTTAVMTIQPSRARWAWCFRGVAGTWEGEQHVSSAAIYKSEQYISNTGLQNGKD